MDWQDQGTLLSVRPHGETSAIIEVFTEAHGRHAGVVRGGTSRRASAVLQPGTDLALVWRARLADHIGTFTAEPLQSRSGLMESRAGLAGLNAICALLRLALPERDPHPGLWVDSRALLDVMAAGGGWGAAYLAWEARLLDEIGFGLDLSACAVTGALDDLAYVSPKTGRAVSRKAAADWADRLLPLPAVMTGAPEGAGDVAQGLRITGHFLLRGLAPILGERGLPEARARLVAMLARG
jgi:DNA repair protein RecO (recombination protein O)